MSRIPSRAHPLTVGVVGLGAIGRRVCQALDAGLPGLTLAGATARIARRAEAFLKSLGTPAPFLTLDRAGRGVRGRGRGLDPGAPAGDRAQGARRRARPDRALVRRAPRAVRLGGAGRAATAAASWCRRAPSPASTRVKGGAVGPITSVTMESRKAPAGWAGAPWVVQQKIDLDAIREETLIFEGPATAACPAFPANVNVLAALSLAGIGPERTTTRIFAVPGLARNTHRISVEGEFGSLSHRGPQRAVREPADRPAVVPVDDRPAARPRRHAARRDLSTDSVRRRSTASPSSTPPTSPTSSRASPGTSSACAASPPPARAGPMLEIGCGAAGHIGRYVADLGRARDRRRSLGTLAARRPAPEPVAAASSPPTCGRCRSGRARAPASWRSTR